MPKFEIEQFETRVTKMTVEAKTFAEAIDNWVNDEYDGIPTKLVEKEELDDSRSEVLQELTLGEIKQVADTLRFGLVESHKEDEPLGCRVSGMRAIRKIGE